MWSSRCRGIGRARSSRRASRSGSADSTELSRSCSRFTRRALTTGEISARFAEIYVPSISKETISRITDRVLEEMSQWAARPLDAI